LDTVGWMTDVNKIMHCWKRTELFCIITQRWWFFITDFSVQYIVPIIKDQNTNKKCLAPEDGTDIFSPDVSKKLPILNA